MNNVTDLAEPTPELLRQIMADVGELLNRHGWQSEPRRHLAYLLSETIELAEEVLRLPESGPASSDELQKVGREVYDVLWNACALARSAGVDIVAAAADKRTVNANRIWSTESLRHSGAQRA
jgi:NTP pyrophosphatase (non-canonical NTP hydrolase)